MRDCLRDACQAVGEARAEGETALSPAALQTFHARYREALREGLAWHRSLPRGETKGRRQSAAPPAQFKDHVLRFPVDFDAPFTNNLAERLRPLFPSGSRSRALAANLIPALCVRPFSYRDLFCAQMIDSNP
jgi:hypothetical protein